MYSKGFRPLAAAAVLTTALAFSLVFFYAPLDADQGFVQKIFYVHVPMAIVALRGFVAAGVMAIRHLRSGDRSWDMRSYVTIHMSIILGMGVLVTGSIWAKAAWGHWWVWDEPVLVSFLVVFLLYCVYYPLRFSIEDPDRQARYSSGFATPPAPSFRSTSSRSASPSHSRTRACSRRPAARSPATCASPSSSASSR